MLRLEMEAAAAALNFEEAGRLRDRISLMRGSSDETTDEPDTAGLTRQQPGSMGLGTSRQRIDHPPGWTKPAKPDPMTRGRGRKPGSAER